MNIERFTEKAQQAIVQAQAAATRLEHNELDAEHILLALLEQEEGLVPQILKKTGVEPAHVLQQVQTALRDRPKVSGDGAGQLHLSARADRVLQDADKEAKRFKDEFVSTEHLLLAILSLKDGDAAHVFKTFGVDRAKVLSLLKDPDRAASMGERGRATAASDYDIDRVVERMETVFSSLLERVRASRGERSEGRAGGGV